MPPYPSESAQRLLVVDVGTTKIVALLAVVEGASVVVVRAHTEAWLGVVDGAIGDVVAASALVREVVHHIGAASDLPRLRAWVPHAGVRGAIAAVQRAGLEVAEVIPAAIASAASVCTDDELDRGVVLLDLGATRTGVAVIAAGSVCHAESLPIGAADLTRDLAAGLDITLDAAEDAKRSHTSALAWLVEAADEIELVGSGRRVPRRHLSALAAPVLDVIFGTVRERVAALDVHRSGSPTCVLTGGGAALAGLVEHAELVLGMPARVGWPRELGGVADSVSSLAHAASTGVAALAGGRRPAAPAPVTIVPPLGERLLPSRDVA